ncbi:C40 family peptidase [Kluyvera sp. CRP]|uniref:C40 family peptidase n=1 Tax=Kluyvera sp. CRP TaxID=2873269 RepID=UPI001CC21F76|nr:C40 family peptidase [Kluyvera sp. CRP]UAK18925.1 C40 family peptidase [Kluyvera sp. CRP]
MAQIKKWSFTLCALLFTSLSFTPLAHATGHAKTPTAQKSLPVKGSERKKKNTVSKSNTKKKTATTVTKKKTTSVVAKKAAPTSRKTANVVTTCKTTRKGHKKTCTTSPVETQPTTIAQAHKVRVQKAQKTAMNKLMGQLGKPYRWGGNSPRTGFDCSGLVYYAYKDLVNIRIPRTANEMYHLRDARPVNRSELESGDLVFFRTQGRGTADHVGVYVGNGKFIQSPRTGQDIQITSLSEDYWVRHYVGARRVVTPKTIR